MVWFFFSMNLIPHVKGAEKAFGIGSLHELRGTIGSIADELVAEILCDWALVVPVKRWSRTNLNLRMTKRRASDESIINVTADYNVSSIIRIGGAAPHRFFEPGVRKPLTFEVTIKCFVKGARAGGDSHRLLEVNQGWRGRRTSCTIPEVLAC